MINELSLHKNCSMNRPHTSTQHPKLWVTHDSWLLLAHSSLTCAPLAARNLKERNFCAQFSSHRESRIFIPEDNLILQWKYSNPPNQNDIKWRRYAIFFVIVSRDVFLNDIWISLQKLTEACDSTLRKRYIGPGCACQKWHENFGVSVFWICQLRTVRWLLTRGRVLTSASTLLTTMEKGGSRT